MEKIESYRPQKSTKQKYIIDNYANDYKGMAMDYEEMQRFLCSFVSEYEEVIPKVVKDFAHQEAVRIVDGEFDELGQYKRNPISSIDLVECEIGENKGGGVEITTIYEREDKIAYIENIIIEII